MTIINIDVETANHWLTNGDAVLVDVREPAEHASVSIAYAELKPLSRLSADDVPMVSDKKVIVHCKGGKRSHAACEQYLRSHPEMTLYNLEGGIMAWQQAGFDTVEKSSRKVLPLDRQVQVTVGLMILIGVILGYFCHVSFLLIPLFFGAGLVFSGLSGTCGLAMLLAKMPWNQTLAD